MADQRSAHRVPVRLRASFRTQQSVIEGWVSDLSRMGLFLRANHRDAAGSRGTIDLELPQGTPLRLPGEVVRVVTGGEPGLAIRFGELPDEARRPLANLMIESSFQNR